MSAAEKIIHVNFSPGTLHFYEPETTFHYSDKVSVIFNTDLRASKEEKEARAGAGWGIFVNKRSNLLHCVHGNTGVLIRMVGNFHTPEVARREFFTMIRRAIRDLPPEIWR